MVRHHEDAIVLNWILALAAIALTLSITLFVAALVNERLGALCWSVWSISFALATMAIILHVEDRAKRRQTC